MTGAAHPALSVQETHRCVPESVNFQTAGKALFAHRATWSVTQAQQLLKTTHKGPVEVLFSH